MNDPGAVDNILLDISRRGLPIFGVLELTHRCNARCPYCYIAARPPLPEMSTAQVKRAIDKLYDAGVVTLGLTGGEPCMRQDLNEILTYACAKGFFTITLLTNGTLLSPQLIDTLSGFPNISITVRMSVFSCEAAVNDGFMGVSGALEKIIDNGKKLMAGGVEAAVLMNALEFNLAELKKAHLFFSEMGFSFSVGYEKVLINSDRYDLGPMVQSSFFLRFLQAAPEPAVADMLGLYRANLNNGYLHQDLCQKLMTSIEVFPNGDIAPCLSLRSFPVGNIVADDRTLSEILNSSGEYQTLKSLKKSDIAACRDCQFVKYCTICPGLMHEMYGGFLRPPEQVCNLARALHDFSEHSVYACNV
ncbi:MAG: radical SAM protein [Chitinivibrionales bacterium]|nr:radical SAM protein [Chitinivibrionales bacterium]